MAGTDDTLEGGGYDNFVDAQRAGDTFRESEQYEDAITAYRACLGFDPDAFLIRLKLGFCYGDLNETELKMEAFDSIASCNLNSPDHAIRISELMSKSDGRTAAIAVLDESLKRWPDQLNLRQHLMATLVGDRDVTLEMYLKAMEDRSKGKTFSNADFVDICGGMERVRSCCSHFAKWVSSDVPDLARTNVLAMLFLLADDMGTLAEAVGTLPVSSYKEARFRADVMFLAGRESEAKEAYAQSYDYLRGDASSTSKTTGVKKAVSSSNSSLPIVTIHLGNQEYFQYCLQQNLRSNPESRMVVLGDRENCFDQIEHHFVGDLVEGSKTLIDTYSHTSVNPFSYEVFCIERWLILLEYCRQQGLSEVFHVDSDVMLFTELNTLLPYFRKFKAIASFSCGSAGYFKVEALEEFVDYINSHYGNSANEPYHVTDMCFFRHFQREYGWGFLDQIHDGGVFDNVLSRSDGYRFHAGEKVLELIDGQVMGYHEASERHIKFHSVHLQGLCKRRANFFDAHLRNRGEGRIILTGR